MARIAAWPEKAWELYRVIVGLMQWGERYLADPACPRPVGGRPEDHIAGYFVAGGIRLDVVTDIPLV